MKLVCSTLVSRPSAAYADYLERNVYQNASRTAFLLEIVSRRCADVSGPNEKTRGDSILNIWRYVCDLSNLSQWRMLSNDDFDWRNWGSVDDPATINSLPDSPM